MEKVNTTKEITKFLKDATVFISGGTGSFGNALLDYLRESSIHFIIYSRDESKQHDMYVTRKNENISYIVGDVRDKKRLIESMQGVDYVFHAAALKHVSVCESHPIEAVKTNILGAYNILDAAIYNNVEKIIAITTDKGVLPFNVMGMTKAIQERMYINTNKINLNGFLDNIVIIIEVGINTVTKGTVNNLTMYSTKLSV